MSCAAAARHIVVVAVAIGRAIHRFGRGRGHRIVIYTHDKKKIVMAIIEIDIHQQRASGLKSSELSGVQ